MIKAWFISDVNSGIKVVCLQMNLGALTIGNITLYITRIFRCLDYDGITKKGEFVAPRKVGGCFMKLNDIHVVWKYILHVIIVIGIRLQKAAGEVLVLMVPDMDSCSCELKHTVLTEIIGDVKADF